MTVLRPGLVAVSPTYDPVPILAQYGIVGLLAVFGFLGTRYFYRRLEQANTERVEALKEQVLAEQQRTDKERERGDRLEERLRNVADATQQLLAGPLGDATRAIAEAMELIRDAAPRTTRGRRTGDP